MIFSLSSFLGGKVSTNLGAIQFHINIDTYNELPGDLQNVVMQAGREATEWRAKQVEANLAAKDEELRAHDMKVVERIDDALAAKLNKAAQPIIDDWKAKAGPRAEEILGAFNKNP